jgi:protein-disulfide isomerase
MDRLVTRLLCKILQETRRNGKKMADLDQALQDVLNEIGQLPGLITQAVQAAVTAANGGDAAQLQAALQHQQNVADSLEQGVAAIQAAFNVPAPAPAAPISIPPAGAPAPNPVVVTDSSGTPVNGPLTPDPTITDPTVTDPNQAVN